MECFSLRRYASENTFPLTMTAKRLSQTELVPVLQRSGGPESEFVKASILVSSVWWRAFDETSATMLKQTMITHQRYSTTQRPHFSKMGLRGSLCSCWLSTSQLLVSDSGCLSNYPVLPITR